VKEQANLRGRAIARYLNVSIGDTTGMVVDALYHVIEKSTEAKYGGD
jgi:hypothetical protein